MTQLEQQIIALIEGNKFLSEELKKKYILALFLMDRSEQQGYLEVVKAFDYRCGAIDRGVFVLKDDDKQKLMRTLEDVKEDLLRKLHSPE